MNKIFLSGSVLRRVALVSLVAMGVTAAGCASVPTAQSSGGVAGEHEMARQDAGVAVIHPTKGNTVHGIVRFTPVAGGVRVVAELSGLAPNSEHGFHIHEYGDCSAADATSAGGHYNPEHHHHAGLTSEMRHAGDLGNIQADADGNAHLDLIVDNITVDGAKNPILGRAVIVHAKADDLKSQPTGDAGGRIGCGVIGLARP